MPPAEDGQDNGVEPSKADLQPFDNFTLTGAGEGIPTYLQYNLTNTDAVTRSVRDEISVDTGGNDIGFTNFTFNDVSASNASYNLELTNNDVQSNSWFFPETFNITYYQQFFLPTDAYLNFAAIYLQIASFPLWVNMSVYNATWDFALQTYVPDKMIDPTFWKDSDAQANGMADPRLAHWEVFNFTSQRKVLNFSRTMHLEDLAIFYIGLTIPTNYSQYSFFWYDAEDSFGWGENGGDAWMEIVFPGGGVVDGGNQKLRILQPVRSWDESPEFVDFTLAMDFAPLSNTPKPSQVGLKVDGVPVQDLTANTGSYVTNQLKQHSGSACIYEMSSAWTDFFGLGNLTFQLDQAYTVQQEITPLIEYLVNVTENVAEWNLTVVTNYPPLAIINSTQIEFRLPTNWNVTKIVNWTNEFYDPWVPGKEFWNATIQDADYNRTSIMNASSGTWLLNARSPLYEFSTAVNTTFLTTYYYTNISDNLQLTGNVPGGPNGIPVFKHTDTDGEITDLHVTKGSILNQQDKLTTSDNVYLWMLTQNESYQHDSVVEMNFSLSDTTGVLQHLLNQINVTIEQLTSNSSKDEELFDQIWVDEMLAIPQFRQYMNDLDLINGSVIIQVKPNAISPVDFNFYADWMGNVQKEEILGLRVSFVHVLSQAFRSAQETMMAFNFVAGEWQPLDRSCLMVSDVRQDATHEWRFVVWDSALNASVDVSDFIQDGTNQVWFRLNSTRPAGPPDGFYELGIDYIHLTYTFLNPVGAGNLTLSLFNQTLGAFDTPQALPINSQDSVTSFNFPTNVGDYYNVTANNLQLRINLTHWAPSVAAELIDHLYVTINYSQVLNLNWKQYIVDVYEDLLPTFPETIGTYDNAMQNNITFGWDIDSTTLTPGSYSWVTLCSMGSQIAVNTTDILVKGLPTSILPDAGSGVIFQDGNWVTQPNPYVNDTSKAIRVRVNDTVYGVNLTSITIETPTWSTGQLLVINEFATSGLEEKRGYYTIYLNTTGLAASTVGYNLTLNVTSPIYLSSWVNVTVRVDEIPSSLGVVQPSFTVWENETLDIGASFEDTFHHNLITGAALSWEIVEDLTKQGTFTQILYVYETSIDTLSKKIAPRIQPYHLRINGTKTDFQNASIEVFLTVLAKNRTVLTADFNELHDNILEGTVIGVSATLKYDGNNTAIPNVEVEFVFKLLSGTTQEEIKKKGLTDANGLASVDFLIPAGVTSISVSANYGGTESIARSEANPSGTFVIITPTQQLINTLIEYSPYIIAAIGAVIALSLYTRAQNKKKARFWDTRVSKLNDVLNIQHVLVIHKDSGTAILSQSMGTEKIDPNLISGFLTAMTSFQSEIAVKKKDGQKEGKKGFLLDYADFKILLEDGEFTRTALILEADASDTLKETLIRFIQRYESRYHKELAAWRGNLKELEGGENLIEEVFEISLIYPHVPNPSINTKKLPKLQKAIYEIARAITKERPFFFMSRLLEYAIAGRKESKNQIWSVIYDMKRTHLLEPMTVANPSQ